MAIDWFPFFLTLKISAISSFILLIIGVPLCWWLVFKPNKYKIIIEIITNLPLILPPTVLGFYLLRLFNSNFIIGKLFEKTFGYTLSFSVTGLVIGSIIYSLPFIVQPLVSSFKQIPIYLIESARVLGKNEITILIKVILPNAITGVISGLILTFMHTIGEFGVVLMIGGNIPNKTQVVSIKLYQDVETLNYGSANIYAIILVIFSFIALLMVSLLNNKSNRNNYA